MKSPRFILSAGAIALALALSGCYESVDFTRAEPGVYKGKEDPLLAMLEEPELREQLDRRFDGQRDR
ncbi:MAG: hypothetical protein ACXIUM_00505 [Wenzhouxiangella sp.]